MNEKKPFGATHCSLLAHRPNWCRWRIWGDSISARLVVTRSVTQADGLPWALIEKTEKLPVVT